MKKILTGLIMFLLTGTTFATFNSITDGDPGLAAPIMQNFRHVNFGSVLKPVDTNGLNSSATLDLGTNTVLWRDLYLSGTVKAGVWNGDVVIGTYGGTGINNSTRTLTLNNSTTITTAAATVLDDTTVSAMVDTIGGASATGTGGLVRSGAPTLTAAYIIQNSGAPQLQVGRSVNNGIFINGQGGAAHYNFSIAQQNNVDGGLEFTPSTTVSGTTFSTPAMVVLRTGNVGIGTNAPSTTLDVVGTGKFSSHLTVDTNTLYVDATNHRVGIGTNSPADILEVANQMRVSRSSNAAQYGAITCETGNFILNAVGPINTVFSDNGTERVRIENSTGRVGIGTNVPSTTLDVVGTAKISSHLTVDTNTLFIDATNHSVGIGTTTPTTLLDVVGASKFSGNLAVDTNTLYIDATNNRVGIGTTTPDKTLDVVGTIKSTEFEVSGNITLSGDIYTRVVSYNVLIGDVTGLSSFGTHTVYGRFVGKTAIVDFDIDGISSTTGFTVTLPSIYTASSTGAPAHSAVLMVLDNVGNYQVGRVEVLAGTSTFTFFKGVTDNAASFTVLGTKGVKGTIIYSVN